MSQDIQRLLDGWEFEPDQLQVRFITGDDGREKIQMRIDLGLIQLELTGRPDGERPEGHESLLEYYEAKAQEAIESGSAFSLGPEDCSKLMREGCSTTIGISRPSTSSGTRSSLLDTAAQPRLFAFVGRHAARQRDKMEFDKYRPYVQMMNTRASASMALKEGDHRAALALIDAGIKAIRKFLREYKQEEREHECAGAQVPAQLAPGSEARTADGAARATGTTARAFGRSRRLRRSRAAARPDPRSACPSAAVRHAVMPFATTSSIRRHRHLASDPRRWLEW